MKNYLLICSIILSVLCSFFSCGKTESNFQLIKISGDNQTKFGGDTLTNPIRIQLVDGDNVGLSNTEITFRVSRGGGYLNSSAVFTDNQGYAEVEWTLGLEGAQNLIVEVSNMKLVVTGFSATVSGGHVNFVTNSFADSRDGIVYGTIQLGMQTWMSENLRYNISGSWLNSSNPTTQYGRLYDWQATTTACPSGWHLPTDQEWIVLEEFVGMETAGTTGYRGLTTGERLKSTTGWGSTFNGTDLYGFNVLPAGSYDANGYAKLGTEAFYWTAKTAESINSNAWSRTFYSNFKSIGRYTSEKEQAFSCRCIQD